MEDVRVAVLHVYLLKFALPVMQAFSALRAEEIVREFVLMLAPPALR